MQTSREKDLRETDFHARAVSYRVWATIIPLAATLSGAMIAILTEIRDSLQRIKQRWK